MWFYAVKHLKFFGTGVNVLLVMLHMCDFCLQFFNPIRGIINRKWNTVPCSVTLNRLINFCKITTIFYTLNGYFITNVIYFRQTPLDSMKSSSLLSYNNYSYFLTKTTNLDQGRLNCIILIQLLFWLLLTVEVLILVWNSSLILCDGAEVIAIELKLICRKLIYFCDNSFFGACIFV